jgi:hypothetical protein
MHDELLIEAGIMLSMSDRINPEGQALVSGNRARYPPWLMGDALKSYPYELHSPKGIPDDSVIVFDVDDDDVVSDEFLEGFVFE